MELNLGQLHFFKHHIFCMSGWYLKGTASSSFKLVGTVYFNSLIVQNVLPTISIQNK